MVFSGLVLAVLGMFGALSSGKAGPQLASAQGDSGALIYYAPVITPLVTPTGVTTPVNTPFQPQPEPVILTQQPTLPPPTPTATPLPSPTPTPVPTQAPVRLQIPVIELDAPIEVVGIIKAKVNGEKVRQWDSPDRYAVGWHEGSALLGQPGNTVLNGHHNDYGEVFGRLKEVNLGDEIVIIGEAHIYHYVVVNKMVLPEKYQELDLRMENARWILPSEDERLTLITCWPKQTNSHRLILVARPISVEPIATSPAS